MKSIVLTALSIFLGLFFMLMGTLKVSQVISRDIHRELRRNFIHFAKHVPIAAQLGWTVSPKAYRLAWGYLELASGFLLCFVPGRVKLVANSVLASLALAAIHHHYAAGDKFERVAPCIVFALMLICRLVVHYQVCRREQRNASLRQRYLRQSEALLHHCKLTTRPKAD